MKFGVSMTPMAALRGKKRFGSGREKDRALENSDENGDGGGDGQRVNVEERKR